MQLAVDVFQSILRACSRPGIETENTYRILFSAHQTDLIAGRRKEARLLFLGTYWNWHSLGREFQKLKQLAKEAGLKLGEWQEYKHAEYCCIEAHLSLWDAEKEESERQKAIAKLNKITTHLYESSKIYPHDGEVKQQLDKILMHLTDSMIGLTDMKTLGEDERWVVRWIGEFAKLYQEHAEPLSCIWHEMKVIKEMTE